MQKQRVDLFLPLKNNVGGFFVAQNIAAHFNNVVGKIEWAGAQEKKNILLMLLDHRGMISKSKVVITESLTYL